MMTTQETAFVEIERLVKSFKDMPAAQRKGLNEMQTRLGHVLPLTNQTRFARNGAIILVRIVIALLPCEPRFNQPVKNVE